MQLIQVGDTNVASELYNYTETSDIDYVYHWCFSKRNCRSHEQEFCTKLLVKIQVQSTATNTIIVLDDDVDKK